MVKFKLPITLPDKKKTIIELYPVRTAEDIVQENNRFIYAISGGEHLCLSSKENSDYRLPPENNAFGLTPDTDYVIEGTIIQHGSTPTLVMMEYNHDQLLLERKYRLSSGSLHLVFRTKPDCRLLCLAIRFEGTGKLDIKKLCLKSIDQECIYVFDIQNITDFSCSDPEGVAVIMPCTDTKKGLDTARVLYRRAKMPCKIIVVDDTLRQGFIKTLNDTASKVDAKYIVYLAQDAWPGRDWLKCAYDSLEKSGKGLLAFNDGKWHGRIASFGMVRTCWVKRLYGGYVFFPEYKSHKADNELTVIARALNNYEYNPNCTLVEHDQKKDFGGSNPLDNKLFKKRYVEKLSSHAPLKSLKEMAHEYHINFPESKIEEGFTVILLTIGSFEIIEKFISSFIQKNSYNPFEMLIIDQSSSNSIQTSVEFFAQKAIVRYFRLNPYSLVYDSLLIGHNKAKYPNIFLVTSSFLYTSDFLTEFFNHPEDTVYLYNNTYQKEHSCNRNDRVDYEDFQGLICSKKQFHKFIEYIEINVKNDNIENFIKRKERKDG